MVRTLRIFFLLIFFWSSLFPQGTPKEVDSVKALLKSLSRRDPKRVDALIYIGKYGKKDKIKDLEEAVAIAENINYRVGMINAYSTLGSLVEQESNYSEALEYYYKSAEIAEQIDDQKLIYSIYGQIFNVTLYLGDYPKSLSIALKNLAYAEKKGDTLTMAGQYNNLGYLYGLQNNYAKTKEYLLKFYELAEKIGDDGMIANACSGMADIYEKENNYPAALEKLFRALSIYEKVHERKQTKEPGNKHMFQYIALTYNGIANLYRASNDIQTALKYSLKCLDAAKQVSVNKYDLAFFYITNGNLYTLLGEYVKAESSLNKGLAIANEIGHMEDRKLAYLGLSEMYAAKKDFKLAVENHKKFTEIKDSILNEKNSKQMTEMNTRYESEKKDKELLKKDVEIAGQMSRAKQKLIIRNAFLGGFCLVALLAIFIFRGYTIKRKTNEVMSQQKSILEHKNKEITDSIHYAKRIQNALLASKSLLAKKVPEHFVLYKPKDIVSGDFYWAHEVNGKFLICIADSTGHGVPGAFMSLLNISFLNEAVAEKKMEQPELILNSVRQSLINTLNTEGNENSKDGMDCVLCAFDHKGNKMTYAAANNAFYIIRDNELIVSLTDKMPVGRSPRETEEFKLHELNLKNGDMIYILTDGYADQFGGPNGKKFRYKQLEQLLVENHQWSMQEQKDVLDRTLEKWKGGIEQVDDILIVGIRYKA